MQFIINHSSMEPIYEQIMGQIRSGIAKGTMKEGGTAVGACTGKGFEGQCVDR